MQSFKLLVRTALFSLAFLIAGQAHSALLIFTDRTAWQTAAGGGVGDLFEDFNSFTQDTFYGAQHGAVGAGFLTLDLADTGDNDTSWRIEVPPLTAASVPDVDGTSYATTFGYEGSHTQADTLMSFSNVGAIGFDYKDGSYGDANGLLTTSLGDSVSLTNVNSTDTFFLGFVYTEGEVFNSLLWGLAPGGGIGYGIGIDNVEAYSSVNLKSVSVLLNYDDFNAKKYNGCKYCINSEKWRGQERGDYNTEVLRAIKSKKARLSHTSWGTTNSDAGSISGKNRLTFNKRESADISGACFTPRIKNYLIKSCAANDDHGHVRVRYIGNFYDTDNEDEGDEDGLIYAGIEMIRHGNSGDAKTKFEISGWAVESEGKDGDTEIWTTYDDYGFTQPDLNFGTVKASKNKKAMCVGYDRVNHELVFSFGTDERRVNAADHGLPDFGDDVSADMAWHTIEARTDVVNCTAGALRGSVDAYFDNVKVKQYVDPE